MPKLTCALDLFQTETKQQKKRSSGEKPTHTKNKSKNTTYIIVEAAVCVSEPLEVAEGIVRREVLELHEELREYLLHRLHELVHEFIHLRRRFRPSVARADHELQHTSTV